MKFLKDMKNKIIKQADEKNQNTHEIQNDKEAKGELDTEINLKAMAKSIFNRFRDTPKSAQITPDANKQIISELVKNQGVFWKVAPVEVSVTAEKQTVKPQTAHRQEIKQAEHEQSQIDADVFVSNLCSHAHELQLNEKRKVLRARDAIFKTIQIEPIYMLDDSISKILKLELEGGQSEMIERSQILVNEKNNIDRAIESVLISGYLWQANNMEDRNFIEICFQTINKSITSIVALQDRVKQIRAKFALFVGYFRKVNQLNHRRTMIVKKLKVLNKIKPYKKDIDMQFANIDQAFYIERNRQKLHAHFMNEPTFTEKVLLFKSILSLISKQNKKLVSLVESELRNWIDNGQKLELKHVQKLLILLYFTKYEKMYTDNKMFVNLSQIRNRNKFIEELSSVKSWKDYKYVNDPSVKNRVTKYLDQLIMWLNRQQERDRKKANKNNESEIEQDVKSRPSKQRAQAGIKLSKHVKEEQLKQQKQRIDTKQIDILKQKRKQEKKEKDRLRYKQGKQVKQKQKKEEENTKTKQQEQSENGNNIQIIVFDEMHKAKQKLQGRIKF